jgi:hypothetical protein
VCNKAAKFIHVVLGVLTPSLDVTAIHLQGSDKEPEQPVDENEE